MLIFSPPPPFYSFSALSSLLRLYLQGIRNLVYSPRLCAREFKTACPRHPAFFPSFRFMSSPLSRPLAGAVNSSGPTPQPRLFNFPFFYYCACCQTRSSLFPPLPKFRGAGVFFPSFDRLAQCPPPLFYGFSPFLFLCHRVWRRSSLRCTRASSSVFFILGFPFSRLGRSFFLSFAANAAHLFCFLRLGRR